MVRWTPGRKIEILYEIYKNPEKRCETLKQNGISEEEFDVWRERYEQCGVKGLYTTKISKLRRSEVL